MCVRPSGPTLDVKLYVYICYWHATWDTWPEPVSSSGDGGDDDMTVTLPLRASAGLVLTQHLEAGM